MSEMIAEDSGCLYHVDLKVPILAVDEFVSEFSVTARDCAKMPMMASAPGNH